MTWSVSIPGQPPSANHQYERNAGNAGQHKRSGIEAYQTSVTYLVRQARPSGWVASPMVVVEYRFFVKRDIDCTNAIKIIEDAIAMALCPGSNPPRCCNAYDARFLPRAMDKQLVKSEPRVEVTIRASD